MAVRFVVEGNWLYPVQEVLKESAKEVIVKCEGAGIKRVKRNGKGAAKLLSVVPFGWGRFFRK